MNARCRLPAIPGRQHGFVLVLTLWVLVIVAFAAAYFSERVANSVELAQQSQQNTRAMLDMDGTRAEILYRLGTTSLTEYGLGRGNDIAVALDNRPYRGLGDTIIQLQDNRGLLNLNIVEDDRLHRLLGLLNVPADRRGRLIDTLRDYTDADTLHRLNGAEKEDYLALDLPAPPNNILSTPWEVRRIIGWRDTPELWHSGRLLELVTTSASLGINPNTAPAEVLATLPGITEEAARLIIAQRQLAPFTSAVQLAQVAGVSAQPFEDSIGVIPSNCIRITQSIPGQASALQYNIRLTPSGNEGPWRTDYYTRVSVAPGASALAAPSPLPPRSLAPHNPAPF